MMKASEYERRAQYFALRAAKKDKAESSTIPHGVLWEGFSPFDGAPIVAIATADSANRKTGPMTQVYILRADLSPREALTCGADQSVCGNCPLRGKNGKNRSCYVQIDNDPGSVWRTYKAGRYKAISPNAFKGRAIRWGAYGDPSMLPESLVRECNSHASHWTGYTHQWGLPFAQWSNGVFMASVDTPALEKRAYAKGWGTFRVGATDGNDWADARLCEAEVSKAQCLACGECNGQKLKIVVPAHGAGMKHTPAEKRRRLSVLA